jgi:hypothetical protein
VGVLYFLVDVLVGDVDGQLLAGVVGLPGSEVASRQPFLVGTDLLLQHPIVSFQLAQLLQPLDAAPVRDRFILHAHLLRRLFALSRATEVADVNRTAVIGVVPSCRVVPGGCEVGRLLLACLSGLLDPDGELADVFFDGVHVFAEGGNAQVLFFISADCPFLFGLLLVGGKAAVGVLEPAAVVTLLVHLDFYCRVIFIQWQSNK